MAMRGWFKQGSRLILSVVTSVALIAPSISSAEVIQEPPSSMEMLGDLIIARPLLLAATALGTAAFIITLPFSAMGGNTKESAQTLIADPGDSLLFRCLGCTEQEDEARDQQRAKAEQEQEALDAIAAEAAKP